MVSSIKRARPEDLAFCWEEPNVAVSLSPVTQPRKQEHYPLNSGAGRAVESLELASDHKILVFHMTF